MQLIKLIAISLMMSSCVAWNILVIAPYPSYYRWTYVEKLIDGLLQNGHSVSAITQFLRADAIPLEKYTEYEIDEFPLEKFYTPKDIFEGKFDNDISHIKLSYQIGLALSEHVLNNQKVRKFINNRSLKFDLVIVDHINIDSLYIFAAMYKCPLITLGIDGHVSNMDEAMGVIPSFPIVPHSSSKYDYKMTFMQRTYNALLYMYESAIRKFSFLPAQNKLAQKVFKNEFKEVPQISQVGIDAIIVNNHRDFNLKPKVSAQLDIPAVHIKPVGSLSEDIGSYYDIANDVIYVSFGSYDVSQMPKVKLDALINGLAATKMTIFMQIDGTLPSNLPTNIIAKNWFPQNDVLGRSKIVLFITHGGTLSYQEGLKNRVPMIIIPFTGEQYRNAMRVKKDGNGDVILFDDLDAKLLEKKILEIVKDKEKKFYSNTKEAQIAFNAAAVEPMKEALFWIENIIRSQGVPKLERAHLSCFQRSGIDVITFYFLILLSIVLFWIIIIKFFVKRYRQKQERGKFKYY